MLWVMGSRVEQYPTLSPHSNKVLEFACSFCACAGFPLGMRISVNIKVI